MDVSSINASIAQLLGANIAGVSASGRSQTNDGAIDKINDSELSKLRKVCQDFEAVFIRQLLRTMRETGPKSDLLDSGFASEIYKDMLDEQLATEMSSTGQFGLADILYEQMKDAVLTQTTDANTSAKAE